MAASWVLARSVLRRHRASLAGLALVLALGLGAALASFETAARTQGAYPSYLGRAEVGELVVNPSLATDRLADLIGSTPGVRSYVHDSLLTATPDRGAPRTQAEVDFNSTQVRLSTDGRYVDQDRPVIEEGRMLRPGAAEAFVNVELAESLDLQVGDTLPLAYWQNFYAGVKVASTTEIIEPLGTTEARIVGIGVFADEVLVDDLYRRFKVLITPEAGAEFDCTLTQPEPDDPRSIDELKDVLVPAGCAMSYQYFSLRVDGGDAGVGAVAEALAQRFADETGRLPAAMQDAGIGFELTPTVTADERERVQQSLEPAVRALQLFGGAAAVAALIVVLLGALRVARRDEPDARVWRELGASRQERGTALAVPLLIAVGAGLLGSLAVAWVTSGLGPVASAHKLDPGGRLGLSAIAVLPPFATSAVVLFGGAVVVAGTVAKAMAVRTSTAAPGWSTALVRGGSPSFTLGVRAAAARGSRALLGASVAAVVAVLATVGFSASIDGFVSDPDQFGWPYDVAATVNYGYGFTTDRAAIAETLDRPEVVRWGTATLSGSLTIKGQTMAYVGAGNGFDAMPLRVVKGELPRGDDEIALGSLTADRLGLSVGDSTRVTTVFGERDAVVRGLVVLPPVGPFQADRTSLGTGAYLSAPFHDAIVSVAAEQFGVDPAELIDQSAGFVAIDLRGGTDPDAFVASIADETGTWDISGLPPFLYSSPVRPATVTNVAAMRRVPTALAGVLALALTGGLVLALAVASRTRRRDLAMLRALGCVSRELRATVRWQALTVVGTGLVVGIPLGIGTGRLAYQAFGRSLGVVPVPVVPLGWVAALAVGLVGIGLLASAGPGHRAARTTAAEALRAP